MPQVQGRALLLQLPTGGSPAYSNLCGLLARSFKIANEVIDVTVPDCTTPTGKLLYDGVYGTQQITISASGKYVDNANTETFLTAIVGQTATTARIIVPNYGTFTGSILVSDYETSGEMTGNMDFSAEITFIGTVTFVAAA